MAALQNLFKSFFSAQQKWNGTPETFLAFIQYLQERTEPDYSVEDIIQLGESMNSLMQVNLKPFKNIKDLVINGTPDHTAVKEIETAIFERRQRVELKKTIYDENVDLGEDDLMNSQSEIAVASRNLADKFSSFIYFGDDKDTDSKNK